MPRKSLVFGPVPQGLLLFFLFSFFVSGRSVAQAVVENPSTVLKEALTAACSQNSSEFVRSLTVRNAEAFGRMTPPARETFLKRFVLLDKPGKPRAQNEASGNVVVFCETPDVTTQMEIAKPELRDNLAYLPLIVKDSTDSAGLNAHHVTMGMVREAGQFPPSKSNGTAPKSRPTNCPPSSPSKLWSKPSKPTARHLHGSPNR